MGTKGQVEEESDATQAQKEPLLCLNPSKDCPYFEAVAEYWDLQPSV